MKEIKFRGKDVLTGKWAYGDLVHNKKITETDLVDRTMVGGYEVDPDLSSGIANMLPSSYT